MKNYVISMLLTALIGIPLAEAKPSKAVKEISDYVEKNVTNRGLIQCGRIHQKITSAKLGNYDVVLGGNFIYMQKNGSDGTIAILDEGKDGMPEYLVITPKPIREKEGLKLLVGAMCGSVFDERFMSVHRKLEKRTSSEGMRNRQIIDARGSKWKFHDYGAGKSGTKKPKPETRQRMGYLQNIFVKSLHQYVRKKR